MKKERIILFVCVLAVVLLAQKALYRRLKKDGEKKIYYVASEGMVRQEDFVDGIHFTDAGMLHYADHLTPILKKVLR